MSDDNVVEKMWKNGATFSTYEQAAARKKELLGKFDLVKIRRCGKGGHLYKIKTWKKPAPKVNKKSKKKNKNENESS